jgi:hypothetical protein
VDVQTHRDHPWERDARTGEPARAANAARPWAWALMAIAGVLAIAAAWGGPPHARPAAPPTPTVTPAPTAPIRAFAVHAVRSHPLGGNRVLVWGSASAPVRASIGLRVRVGGVRIREPRHVPLGEDGLFEAIVRIPPRLAGRRLHVIVDMYVGSTQRRKAGVSSQAA